MRPIPDRLTPLECWPVQDTQYKIRSVVIPGNNFSVDGVYVDRKVYDVIRNGALPALLYALRIQTKWNTLQP